VITVLLTALPVLYIALWAQAAQLWHRKTRWGDYTGDTEQVGLSVLAGAFWPGTMIWLGIALYVEGRTPAERYRDFMTARAELPERKAKEAAEAADRRRKELADRITELERLNDEMRSQ
jgi:hypothetical protein